MQLQGDGLYTALLIKILAYLLALRMKARREFSKWTNTQMMRHLSRHHDLRRLHDDAFSRRLFNNLRIIRDIRQFGTISQ